MALRDKEIVKPIRHQEVVYQKSQRRSFTGPEAQG
jgi:hypothetical protein